MSGDDYIIISLLCFEEASLVKSSYTHLCNGECCEREKDPKGDQKWK